MDRILGELLAEIEDKSLQNILRSILFDSKTRYDYTLITNLIKEHRPELAEKHFS